MHEQQAARDRAVTQRKVKLDKAFKAGGGEALCSSLKEQAAADGARAERQAAEYEEVQQQKAKRECAARALRAADHIAALDRQVWHLR